MNKKTILPIMLAAALLTGCATKAEPTDKEFTSPDSSTQVSTEMTSEVASSEETVAAVTDASEPIDVTSQEDINKYIEVETIAPIYETRKSTETATNFEGQWQQTNNHSSIGGDITISDQDKEKFSFKGEFYYFSHTGDAEGVAYFVSDNTAIYKDEEYDGYIFFHMNDGEMFVGCAGTAGMMGMAVSPNGEYTTGEVVHTNEGIMEETYTDNELKLIKELITEDEYKDVFEFSTDEGVVSLYDDKVLGDGAKCKYVDSFVPTMGGLGYELVLVEDGRAYILLHNYSEDIFYTNDTNWTSQELPEVSLE
ncbi:hypothetical protein SAMN02910275_00024 [Butyrivibrio sp. INlla18]|uniref:hypothetical protein n=1 Tax=Butyrivibrio sp. INlla18 TaxID=1520806 RepID=UPI00088D0982|nr:hypothetical protein [Butyrivibrio sp. INlla18]SDA37687.1 hypothetical protein SAMN02910275_00024 [Butyrivibrio sp. INlla18]